MTATIDLKDLAGEIHDEAPGFVLLLKTRLG
jgi:hypothetical protein